VNRELYGRYNTYGGKIRAKETLFYAGPEGQRDDVDLVFFVQQMLEGGRQQLEAGELVGVALVLAIPGKRKMSVR